MELVSTDKILPVQGPIDYQAVNPLSKLMDVVEKIQLAAEREHYLPTKLQYLFPFDYLEMYPPSGLSPVMDPKLQDNKEDFQKQNVARFRCTDTKLVRGWATVDDWTGSFLRISYDGGPDTILSKAANHQLGSGIKAMLKVRDKSETIDVPYNPRTDNYEVEIWAYPGADLRSRLDKKGVRAIDEGELIVRTDLVQGSASDFAREGLDGRNMTTVSPTHTMHPVLPLPIEIAWADKTLHFWDSQNGKNYRYAFNMVYRGWDNFLGVGVSANPHGGYGFLHYRNVLSNYFAYSKSNELGRDVEPWSFDANGVKPAARKRERFFAVDYLDLHILKPNCAIGLHRHRDNQEIFFLIEGSGIMVCGDWCKLDDRERCFEIRTLEAGSFTLIKPGGLHALMNPTDEDISLFMFGGYD